MGEKSLLGQGGIECPLEHIFLFMVNLPVVTVTMALLWEDASKNLEDPYLPDIP